MSGRSCCIAQPMTTGLIDDSLSTLAPIFAVAFARARPATPPQHPRLP
jgi:hypothetical protein